MFNEHFVRLVLDKRILELVALKKDGRIDAVLGYFYRNGIMTAPLFGYDTELPQNIGLYRMLSVALFYTARDKEILLHESSGAAKFKRYRDAIDEIEYSCVYDRHLPWWRRLCWSFLVLCLEKLGVPLMKKYKL